jgi:membrane associated rhomboid family serine protease
MVMLLKKTLLSKKLNPKSIFLGVASYLCLLLLFVLDDQRLTANGDLVYKQGLYWKAFTTSLMHGDFVHLGHNTLFFVAFAVLLNSYFGLWIFPFLSLVVGGIINLIALKIYPPQVYLVGISGVIYFMAAFWMTMFIFLERHMTVSRRIIITTGVSLVLFFPEAFKKNVSYLAHGLGFGLGIILAIIFFKLRREALQSHEVWIEPTPKNVELENYIDALEAQDEIDPLT